MLVVVHHTLDVSILEPPPEHLRARAHNVEAVKIELKTKGMLGARLDIICAAPLARVLFRVQRSWFFCFRVLWMKPPSKSRDFVRRRRKGHKQRLNELLKKAKSLKEGEEGKEWRTTVLDSPSDVHSPLLFFVFW